MARSISKIRDRTRISKRTKLNGLTPLTSQMENFVRDISRRDDTPLEPLNIKQEMYITAIRANVLTFGIGPAGTGKTFIAACLAAEAMMTGEVEKIILTRPAVEAGEELGFLPGELLEKYEPYLTPFRQILDRRLGRGTVEMFIKNGRIEPAPLAYLRGRTFDDCFVILDEAQNTSPVQMKLFLTRIGRNCKAVIDGDPRQIDIKGPSGLIDAAYRLRYVNNIGVVTFEREDIVRSGIVQDIVEAYENEPAALQRMEMCSQA